MYTSISIIGYGGGGYGNFIFIFSFNFKSHLIFSFFSGGHYQQAQVHVIPVSVVHHTGGNLNLK